MDCRHVTRDDVVATLEKGTLIARHSTPVRAGTFVCGGNLLVSSFHKQRYLYCVYEYYKLRCIVVS
jgi:hypothetical protein